MNHVCTISRLHIITTTHVYAALCVVGAMGRTAATNAPTPQHNRGGRTPPGQRTPPTGGGRRTPPAAAVYPLDAPTATNNFTMASSPSSAAAYATHDGMTSPPLTTTLTIHDTAVVLIDERGLLVTHPPPLSAPLASPPPPSTGTPHSRHPSMGGSGGITWPRASSNAWLAAPVSHGDASLPSPPITPTLITLHASST